MPDIKLKARIQNKYETLENWNKFKKGEFVPLKGEVCYGIDKENLYQKIGDGETDFVNLPWLLNQSDWSEQDSSKPNFISNKIGGYWFPESRQAKNETLYSFNFNDPDYSDFITPNGIVGGFEFTQYKDIQLINFPSEFDVVGKAEGFTIFELKNLTIDKPVTFAELPDIQIFYSGNLFKVLQNYMEATEEELHDVGVYDSEEDYGFLRMVEVSGQSAICVFWISPEYSDINMIDFNVYSCEYVPININKTDLDLSGFVGQFDETQNNTKFAEIFNDYVNNQALGDYSHAEGWETKAYHDGSHAEGRATQAIGSSSHAEGSFSTAIGHESHAEGRSTAKGNYSHAEGNTDLVQHIFKGKSPKGVDYGDTNIQIEITEFGNAAIEYKINKYVVAFRNADSVSDLVHRQNTGIYQIMKYEEIEDKYYVYLDLKDSDDRYGFEQDEYIFYLIDYGANGGAIGDCSHAEGRCSMSLGNNSHAEGENSIAYGKNQHVQGKYNLIDYENKYAMIIGNGNGYIYGQTEDHRSNAMTVDWEGTVAARDYKVFTEDENGNIISKSIQSDMEQSDPTQIDYIKNRTHYKYYEEFDKFIDLSKYGENTIHEGFKLIDDYNYQLTPSGEYKLTLEVLNDNADTVLHTLTEDLQIKNGIEMDIETDGAENIVVLFSAQYNVPVFVSGIDLTEENIITIGEKSLVISAANYYDQGNPVRLTLEGPGFSGKKVKYKKLDKEYLDIKEQELMHNEYQVYWDRSDSITYDYTLTPIDDFENQNVIDFPEWVKTEEEGRVYTLETYHNTPSGFAVLKGMSLIDDYYESVNVILDPNFPKYQYGILGVVAFQKNTDGEYKARSLEGLLGSGMQMGLSIPLREYLDKGYRELEIQFSGNCHCGGDVAYNPAVSLQAICATTKVTDLFSNDVFENDQLMQSTYTEYSDLSEDIQDQYWKTEGSIPFTGVTVTGQENLILSSTRFNGRLKLLFTEKFINCSYEYKLNPMAYRTEDSPHYYYPLNVSDYSIVNLDPNNTFNTTSIITAANYLYLTSIPLTYDTKILGIWRK